MKVKLLLIFFMFWVAAPMASANQVKGVYKNNRGVRQFERDKAVEAFDDFTGALADLPFEGEVHFNIGNTFLRNKEFDKALSEFSQAMKLAKGESAREKEVRFRALFNSAVALTANKQTDLALETYQQALELKPDSIETKTNIELLTAGGGGDGDGEQKSDKKNDKDKKDQGKDGDKDKQPPKVENPRPTPRPFAKDKEVSEQDVKRILEELKRQEEQIRARMQQGKAKDAPPDKDW